LKALLLAGGLATRLRPLTNTRPKHLLPIGNRPHIDHLLHLLQRHGIHDVVLTTSYLAEAFDGTVAAARERGLNIEVTHETEPLGTAGAIKHAEALLGGETFLTFNADVLTDMDLGRLIELHRQGAGTATMLLTPVEDPSAFGVVATDAVGLVERFIEKPAPGEAPTNLINAGIYVMEPEVLSRIPPDEVWSAEHQLFPQLVADEEMFAFELDGYWMDIGTPAQYLQSNMDAVEGRYVSELLPVSAEKRRAAIAAQPDVPHVWSFVATDREHVAPTAGLASAVIGRDCTIGDDAVIFSSVLLPEVHVGRGAQIRRSVLGEGVRVEDGAKIEGVTIGDGETVPAERGAET
jgi:NDP-sugar pyrophosphorylase family protein